jgi:hypothetical protein
MSRTSTVILQTLIIAIFISSMFFFSLAVSHAMPTMHTYEAMGVPQEREFAEDKIERAPSEARFDPPGGFVLTSHDVDEVVPPCDDGGDDDAL